VFDLRIDNAKARYNGTRLISTGKIAASGSAQRATVGTNPIDRPRLSLVGEGSATPDGRWIFSGHLTGSGGLPETVSRDLLHSMPVLGSDARIARGIEASVRLRRLGATVRAGRDDGHTLITALTPVTIAGAGGAEFVLAPVHVGHSSLTIGKQGITGAFNLRLQGGGLPFADATIDPFVVEPNADFDASFRGRLHGTTISFRNVAVAGAGHVAGRGGNVVVALNSCADGSVASVLVGLKPVIANARAQFCPRRGEPLVRGTQQGWAFASDLNRMSGAFVNAQSRFEGARGRITLGGTKL